MVIFSVGVELYSAPTLYILVIMIKNNKRSGPNLITSFTFNGVSCEDLGLTYVPEKQDMYVWNPTKHTIHEQRFDGHPGGYFYGSTPNWKDFVVRCYYEPFMSTWDEETDSVKYNLDIDTYVMNGLLFKIMNTFPIGKTGKLVFSNRNWIYYNVTVVNVDTSKIHGEDTGLVTITFSAYYPFGLSDSFYLDDIDADFLSDAANNSYMIYKPLNQQGEKYHPYPKEITLQNLQHGNTQESVFYNPGNATAELKLKVFANPSNGGILITNNTTNQKCRLAKNPGNHFDYVCDSMTGECYYQDGSGNKTADYVTHDYGFIQLATGENRINVNPDSTISSLRLRLDYKATFY